MNVCNCLDPDKDPVVCPAHDKRIKIGDQVFFDDAEPMGLFASCVLWTPDTAHRVRHGIVIAHDAMSVTLKVSGWFGSHTVLKAINEVHERPARVLLDIANRYIKSDNFPMRRFRITF